VKFRLIYSGPVRSINRDATPDRPDYMALHKHAIRSEFHKQLKRLWQVNKFLSEHKVIPSLWPEIASDSISKMGARWGGKSPDEIPLWEAIARQHPGLNGFRFVPLVSERLHLLCALDILFLRWDGPDQTGGQGQIVSAGDLDNRIKTIIDALRPPKVPNEYVGKDQEQIRPQADQAPMYCLMEDDNQVSHLTVEADRLLELPEKAYGDAAWATVIIGIELRTYYPTQFNLSLV
jgi:hypothetical protein